MKNPSILWLLPIALGIGFFAGRQEEKTDADTPSTTAHSPRETRAATRTKRADPFGGPAFSLSSIDDVRELFKHQRSSVASARLTLSVDSLPTGEIAGMMDLLQEDLEKNPNDYEIQGAMMSALFDRWTLVDPDAALAYMNSCKKRSLQRQMAYRLFDSLAKADPARAVAEVQKMPKGEIRQSASSQVMSALADIDPAAACDLFEKEAAPGDWGRYTASQIFAKWAKADPQAAAARLQAMPLDRVDENCASSLAASWANQDPVAALKWAKTLKGEWKSQAAAEVYRAISRDNPAAAWEQLKGEPGYLRSRLAGGVLDILADEDPQAAFALLQGLGSKSEKRIAADSLLSELSWSDTRLALDFLGQLDDPSTRRNRLGNLMYYASWNDPSLLTEQVAKMTEREKIATSQAVLRGLVSTDPEKAEKYFTDLPETQRTTDALQTMMYQYTDKDPKKAFDFALSLANPQEQTAALGGVFGKWSNADPEAAAEGWKKLPAGQSRLEALDTVASSWGQSDPEAARTWAESLSGTERARALAAVLPAMGRDDPTAASRQLASIIAAPPDGMEKNLASSAGRLAGQWASDDPAAASTWAAGLPDGQSRDEGLKSVSRAWSSYDAIATAQWLGTLPSGSSRDAAIQPLVEQVRKTDPTTAFSWAASISDDNQRLNQLRQTLSAWRGSDLDAARAAFDAANLTSKERKSLSKELD